KMSTTRPGDHEPAGGIGPIDCAVGAHHDVVWAVEFPALVSLRERDERAVRFDAPDRARRPAGNDHAALPVDGHAVGVARGMNQHLLADAGAPLPDRIADNVREQEPPVPPVPDRAFTERDAVGYMVEWRGGGRRVHGGGPSPLHV